MCPLKFHVNRHHDNHFDDVIPKSSQGEEVVSYGD